MKYECPECENLVEIDGAQKSATCSDCKAELCVDYDGEFEGGMWRDLTYLYKRTEAESERKHIIASASFWYRASRDETKSCAERVLCMEQAYNHVENALAWLIEKVPGVREEMEKVTKNK